MARWRCSAAARPAYRARPGIAERAGEQAAPLGRPALDDRGHPQAVEQAVRLADADLGAPRRGVVVAVVVARGPSRRPGRALGVAADQRPRRRGGRALAVQVIGVHAVEVADRGGEPGRIAGDQGERVCSRGTSSIAERCYSRSPT
jgi:hypothetical protein